MGLNPGLPWWLRIPATNSENMIFKKFVDCFVKEVLNSKYFPLPRFVPSFCTETPFDQIKKATNFVKKNLKIQIRNVTELVAESPEQDINLSKNVCLYIF